MSKLSLRTSNSRMLFHRPKWSKKDLKVNHHESKLKPFGFCCSLDRFDPLSRYDQQKPPYESSLMAITSVHECPVSKMQMKFSTPRFTREKKKLSKIKTSEAGDQQRLKNGKLNHFRFSKKDRSIKWYLEDEIALAKDMFWTERQRIYQKASDKALNIARKKYKDKINLSLDMKYPRWYQDFSLTQMKNLMNLENVIRTDYEETKTDGTQITLAAIGVTSTFFKLKTNTINELHKSCNLNSVDFLREIYRILTGNDFSEEEYKKFYDCNERIILSAIAFLTLAETIKELHKRLPAVILPRLPPKPKPPSCLARQKNICPYKEGLFKTADWAGYRNALQKWQKQYKLLQTIPKIILPFKQPDPFFTDGILSEIRKGGKEMYTNFEKISAKESVQETFSTKYAKKDAMSIDENVKYQDDFLRKENLKVEKTSPSDILPMLDDNEKFDFSIKTLNAKPETMEYKICGVPKPPGANKKSWLGEKDAHYMIAGASSQDETIPSCPVTYEITGVANVTPSNSDEKFFAMLKLDDGRKKIFPSGRENLSRKWQEWLQNADEDFDQMEEEADELIKSVQATMKLAFPGPVCDNCCSCRQTRKTYEKLQQNEAPVDNVAQDGEKNKSQNEINTNIIINGATKENGQIQYYISGVQKDKLHAPSQIPDLPAPKPVMNVPSCSCAIQQMTNKDVSPSMSEDDISWTKDEGLCIGKKYRPDELSTYSCKTYPGDKSCRRNPFMKEIIRMKEDKKKIEKREKTEPIEVVQNEIQTATKEIIEKKKDKFIPDLNYPAYDYPWNILRTAPSKTVEADYEKTLKLTPPVLPAITSPLNIQESQKDLSSLQELKEVEENVLYKENNEKTSTVLKKTQEKRSKKKQITVYKKSPNLSNKTSKSTATYKTKNKQQMKLSLPSFNRPIKQSNRTNKLFKYNSIKKDKKKSVIDDVEQVENRKREMAKLKNMFKSLAVLDNIQPAILPEELLATSRSDPEEKIVGSFTDEEESRAISKEPCGWRTKSEQELPAKKTLAYLCEPDYPLETIAVRPGGRPCQCRENRSKKKILMYNMGGLVEKKIGGRRARKTKLEEENRIIDGVYYFTPPVSPRRSDEYIPEYNLVESPYDMCASNVTDGRLKLIERYSGPKSLIEKIQKKSKSCNCSNDVTKESYVDQKKNIEEIQQKLMESKLPEERWQTALKDEVLMDYFTQHKDNVPCWTSCKKFIQSARPRRLKVVKPVCECKYERKIVERNEERTKWKVRQGKLKALEKQPFMHIIDTSRPMIEDKKFIISGVKKMPQEDEYKEDIKYCISDVAENVSMSSPQQIVDGLKMSTPFQTPEPSREDISRAAAPHRHWSPANIPPGPLPRKDAVLKEEMARRKKATDEAFRLMYGNNGERDTSCLYRNYEEICDKKKLMTNHETKESHMDAEKKTSKRTIGLRSPIKKSDKIEHYRDASHKKVTNEILQKRKKYLEEVIDEIPQQDISYKQSIDKTSEKTDERYPINNDDDEDETHTDKPNLMAIIKVELKKMAEEGYTFAKLPKCYLMPHFQNWIMNRQCVTFSEVDKKNLMQATRCVWRFMELTRMPDVEKPSLHMTKYQLKKLTFKKAEKIKEKIKETRAIFHSKIRKARVKYARMMWNTMEFEKFPSTSFKRTFFTYMASKEADGHVYKPWLHSEINESDPGFSCY